jgi:hypothetical protein
MMETVGASRHGHRRGDHRDDDWPHTTLERLLRWEQFGASWRVAAHDGSQVVIALCRCDGGEEVDRLTSADADLLAFVGDRRSSEDPAGGSLHPGRSTRRVPVLYESLDNVTRPTSGNAAPTPPAQPHNPPDADGNLPATKTRGGD